MAIGNSGGRSAGNRQSGDRRATQRERQHIDPPGHSEWTRWSDGQEERIRRDRLMNAIALGIWTFTCVIFAVLVCAWWGLL